MTDRATELIVRTIWALADAIHNLGEVLYHGYDVAHRASNKVHGLGSRVLDHHEKRGAPS